MFGRFNIIQINPYVIVIWVVKLGVLPRIEFNSQEWSHSSNGGVWEKTKVLACKRAGGRCEVGEDKTEAKARTWGDLRQDWEDEWSWKRGENWRVGGGTPFHFQFCWVVSAPERKLIRVVGEPDDGRVDPAVIDEDEVGSIGYAAKWIEEKVESRRRRDGEVDDDDDDEQEQAQHVFHL